MSTPPGQNTIITQQDRKSIIAEVGTPLKLTTLVVLVLEALFFLEFIKENKYIPEQHRVWVLIFLLIGLLVLVTMAFLFTRRAEDVATKAAQAAAAQAARKNFHFSGLVTTSDGLPVPGAMVTLLKNNQPVTQPRKTLMMGDAVFSLPLDETDEVMVRVEKGAVSREKFIITPGYQCKFDVEV